MSYTPDTKKYGADGSGPKVSIVMPLYNHERYVGEAIDSVLGQSFAYFELIIINDGSSDNSEGVVKKIEDERIRYFFQENQGAPYTINRGIQLARGDYISILNSDDVYDPKRIEECLKTLETDHSLQAVFSHLEFIDDEGNFIKYFRGAEENWADHTPETSFKGENNIVLDLLAGNFLVTTSNLFCRKNVFDAIGYFSDLRYAHDYDFFLRLCYDHKVYLIEKPLVKYRVHSLNTVKENEAAVSFEVGLVLSNFFLNYDFHHLYKSEDDIYAAMAKFLNSLNTYDTDRMIMTLLLFGMKYPDIKNRYFNRLLEHTESPFRNVCIERFKKRLEGWSLWQETNERLVAKEKELSEGWSQWQETNERLTTADHKFIALNDSLIEKYNYIRSLQNSRWFRLGRFLTRLFNKLFGRG